MHTYEWVVCQVYVTASTCGSTLQFPCMVNGLLLQLVHLLCMWIAPIIVIQRLHVHVKYVVVIPT